MLSKLAMQTLLMCWLLVLGLAGCVVCFVNPNDNDNERKKDASFRFFCPLRRGRPNTNANSVTKDKLWATRGRLLSVRDNLTWDKSSDSYQYCWLPGVSYSVLLIVGYMQ